LSKAAGSEATEGRARATRASRRRSKISHFVAGEIVRDIVEQDLKEGDHLPTEAAMLEEFDVGRASLREALRLLEAYGLIAIRQGHAGGPVVASVSPDDVARSLSFYFHLTGASYGELMEARLIVEPVMAGLAARRQDPEQMAHLREVVEREQNASFDEDVYVKRADEFHYVVSGMSGNRVLDLIGRALRTLYQEGTASGALLPAKARPQTREKHDQIAAAILAGEAEKAESLMTEHLQTLSEAQFKRTPRLRGERVGWMA
jgi:GntR family transcriptional regulator, transcriptional repressor for pyruvate dehydrogenase complex